MIKVLIWNEFYHEKAEPEIAKIYPDGIHGYLKSVLSDEFEVETATLEDDECCGLTKEKLDSADVLIWWAHLRHKDVPDEVAKMVQEAVWRGLGVIFLHSAHYSKPFKLLMGTSCNLDWVEKAESEKLWVLDKSHPIAKGLPDSIFLEHEETYGEPFDIPEPEQLVFAGSFEKGEIFRSGCCYRRGNGRIFYFQPGHEAYPTYYNKDIQKLLHNAVNWCCGDYRPAELKCRRIIRDN